MSVNYFKDIPNFAGKYLYEVRACHTKAML